MEIFQFTTLWLWGLPLGALPSNISTTVNILVDFSIIKFELGPKKYAKMYAIHNFHTENLFVF